MEFLKDVLIDSLIYMIWLLYQCIDIPIASNN